MRQYAEIKHQYPGTILLFRVGDFYETFGEDAIKAAGILDIVLTKRSNGKAASVELAGFPHHALDTYLPRLVRAGERVAICDQLEDPKKTKTIVKRGVTELVTPGVVANDKIYNAKDNNFLASVYEEKNSFGVSFVDISTGEFMVAQGSFDHVERLIKSLRPSEIIFAKKYKEPFEQSFGSGFYTYPLDNWFYEFDFAQKRILEHFELDQVKGFGIQEMPLAIVAAGTSLHYLNQTHHTDLGHINTIKRIDHETYVWLDSFTIKNLELVQSNHQNGKCLLDIMDHCLSPMGARMLKNWMLLPLTNLKEINKRLDVTEYLVEDESLRKNIGEQISAIGDLERLGSKVALQRIQPREIIYLQSALKAISQIASLVNRKECRDLNHLISRLDPISDLVKTIGQTISEDAPALVNKGQIFKEGFNKDLDQLRDFSNQGKDKLLEIKVRESEATGIPSLKIAFNNVFGYYLEVTNSHKDKVPESWIRKQTLVNAERYITPELKEYEEKILGADDKIKVLEQDLYLEFLDYLQTFILGIQSNSKIIAELDCLISFAETAHAFDYTRPEVNEDLNIAIKDGRHPVIERQLTIGEEYIPNDIFLNSEDQQMIILTGPNMSGKSALLRQTALTCLMAQMGSFVPARHAQIGITDKIYTRVGASDNISQGESTFMVEMVETASILNNLSERSLIILDEIGRGTSTFDGVSLAWSIAEYINQHSFKPKTLFATHYHELNQLENKYPGIVNYHISTKETKKKVIFLRKMVRGGSENSFGIHVAKMAGIPGPVVSRANKILNQLEQDRASISSKKTAKLIEPEKVQLNLFQTNDPKSNEVLEIIKNLNTDSMTPIEALMKLHEISQILDS